MMHEWTAEIVEQYGKVPEPGDTIKLNDREKLVISSMVVNKSKVVLKTHPKGGVRYTEDITDKSLDWDEIDEAYLNDR